MRYCEDCGCRTTHGVCSNCQEELFMISFQGEDFEDPPSKEFSDKAAKQAKYLAERSK